MLLAKPTTKLSKSAATFSLLNVVAFMLRGPVALVLMMIFFDEVLQGYWFTFTSMAILVVLTDLGFTAIMAQFSSHEYAHLKFNKEGRLEGDPEHLERMVSLFRFTLKFAASFTGIAVPIIMGIGIGVLSTHGNPDIWLLPWIFFCLASGGGFFASWVCCFFEGCNKVAKVQMIRFVASLTILIVNVMLILNFNLFALAITATASFVVNLTLLGILFRKAIFQLLTHKLKHKKRWLKEFLRLLWKYTIGWIAAFIIFQVFTPLAFMVYDPVAAGRVGITIVVIQACFTLSTVWVTLIRPRLNMAVSVGDFKTARKLTYKSGFLSLATFSLAIIFCVTVYSLLIGTWTLLDDFMTLLPITLLLIAFLFQIPIHVTTTFSRAHKKEPYLIPSVINAVVALGITVGVVFSLPIEYLFLGFLISTVTGSAMFLTIFFKRRNLWKQFYIDKYIKETKEIDGLRFIKTKLDGVVEIEPILGDSSDQSIQPIEGYNKETFDKAELEYNFIDDKSLQVVSKNTVSPLSLQNAPHAQNRLIYCTQGAILAVAVDLKEDSLTFTKWVKIELSSQNKKMLTIPIGFAFGFITLQDNTQIAQKVDSRQNQESQVNISHNDQDLAIDWGIQDPILLDSETPAISFKDAEVVWVVSQKEQEEENFGVQTN